MADVIGIRFKSCGKIYDFEVADSEIRKGDAVVVESELGLSIGNVVVEKHTATETRKELKKALRKATEEDLRQRIANETIESEAKAYCMERIMARGLPMKLICTEATLDKKRIIFYFSAESRIDFRELVKDLAAKFKTRIEMRQIGVRDEAKLLGGLGICGREVCCKTFLTSFEPISIKMAKRQDLVLNASKLSGVCGRLMCCLGYEYSENGDDENMKNDACVPEADDKVADSTAQAIDEDGSERYIEEGAAGQAQQLSSSGHAEQTTKESGNAGDKADSIVKPQTPAPAADDKNPEKRFHKRRKRPKRRFRR